MVKKQTEKDTEQKADTKKLESAPAVFDVSKPGSTPASPTSRPLIAGHQAILGQDPLLASRQPDSSQPAAPIELKLTKQKKISPISLALTDEKTADNGDDKENQKTADQKDEGGSGAEPASSNSTAAIDALAGEVDAKAQSKEQSKADNERQEKVQGLIDSRKYHLPITEGGKKAASERIVSWLLIFLLIAAVAAWLAVDAGYLDIGIDLPYDFIKN